MPGVGVGGGGSLEKRAGGRGGGLAIQRPQHFTHTFRSSPGYPNEA